MSEPLRPPFSYFGNKRPIAAQVWARLGNVTSYSEPFFGAGAVYFARPNPSGIEIINDLEGLLVNAWRSITYQPEETARLVSWPPSECLPEGTMIRTTDGDVLVEDVKVGMEVLGFESGRLVRTKVDAIKESEASEFCEINNLRLTINHPVWVEGRGYIPSGDIYKEDCILVIDEEMALSVVNINEKGDLNETSVENLCVDRSKNPRSALRWKNLVPRQYSYSWSHLSSKAWWQNAQRLLDTILTRTRFKACLQSCRRGLRYRLGRGRTQMDKVLSRFVRSNESYRWRRRNSWLQSIGGAEAESFTPNEGTSLFSRTSGWYVRQAAYERSSAENIICWYGKNIDRSDQIENEIECSGKEDFGSSKRKTEACFAGKEQTNQVCRNRRDLPIPRCGYKGSGSGERVDSQSNSERIPLPRTSLRVPVKVYNFQTGTGNYFANNILVHNCDIIARHRWLMEIGKPKLELLKTDPFYCDPQIAAFYIYGMACYVGAGWCLGDAYKNQQLKMPKVSNEGIFRTDLDGSVENITSYFKAIAWRMRNTKIACGDWDRVVTPIWTTGNQGSQICSIFADPPYEDNEHSVAYSAGGGVAQAVRLWAIENGNNLNMRICVAGYASEGYRFPETWEHLSWKAGGGYGNQGDGRGRENAKREMLWFSPGCLKPGLFQFMNEEKSIGVDPDDADTELEVDDPITETELPELDTPLLPEETPLPRRDYTQTSMFDII